MYYGVLLKFKTQIFYSLLFKTIDLMHNLIDFLKNPGN